MNDPGNNPWVRLIVWIFLGAIALQLIIAIIRPYLPYILVVALLVAVIAGARWWRDKW